MRTTSRSESKNSCFSNFTSKGSTLLHFMMCFESEMERKRHRQDIMDDSTMQKIHRFKTKLPIERYAQKRKEKQMLGFEGSKYMELSSEVYSAVEFCFNILAKDEGKLIEYVEDVKRLKTEVEEANQNANL
ncbi:hypothetical protein Tco_1563477 [Tanacetum coccineum]